MDTIKYYDINKKVRKADNLMSNDFSYTQFETGKRYISLSDINNEQKNVSNSGEYVEAISLDNTTTVFNNSYIDTQGYVDESNRPNATDEIEGGTPSESISSSVLNSLVGNSSTINNLINSFGGSAEDNSLSNSMSNLKLTEWKDDSSKTFSSTFANVTTYSNIENALGMAIGLHLNGGALTNLAGLSGTGSTIKSGIASAIYASGFSDLYTSVASMASLFGYGVDDGFTPSVEEIVNAMTATFYTIIEKKPGTKIRINDPTQNKIDAIAKRYTGEEMYYTDPTTGNESTDSHYIVSNEITDLIDDNGETYIYDAFNTYNNKKAASNKPGGATRRPKFTSTSDNTDSYQYKKKQYLQDLISKEKNQRFIGGLYVEPYYSGSDTTTTSELSEDGSVTSKEITFNDPFTIPFEFNPKIDEGSINAKYTTTEILNRNLSIKSYVGSDSGNISIELKYIALAPDKYTSNYITYGTKHDKRSVKSDSYNTTDTLSDYISSNDTMMNSYDRNKKLNFWQFAWTPTYISKIENSLKSLVLSTVLKDSGKLIKPPIVQIRMSDNKTYSVGDLYRYPIDSSDTDYLSITRILSDNGVVTPYKRYVVTDVKISPLDDNFSNNYDFYNSTESNNTASIIRRSFSATLQLSEVTKNFLDLVPDYRAYYDSDTSTDKLKSIYTRLDKVLNKN